VQNFSGNSKMKTIITIFIVFITLTTYGQDKAIQTKIISGIILDSLTNEPIAFANVSTDNKTTIVSDLDGKFILKITQDTISVITVSTVGYEKKIVTKFFEGRPLTIKLKPVPLNPESEFIIWGKATDTSYYKNGKIEKINYQGHDEVVFFETGQKKYQSVNGSYRYWYKNGILKSQSVLKLSHLKAEAEWYNNGQIKVEGTMYWGHNKKTNAGDWYKNNDWKYWNKNGKEKRGQSDSSKFKYIQQKLDGCWKTNSYQFKYSKENNSGLEYKSKVHSSAPIFSLIIKDNDVYINWIELTGGESQQKVIKISNSKLTVINTDQKKVIYKKNKDCN